MAYNSDTLTLVENSLSGQFWSVWLLDTTDTLATANTAGYITDGQTKNMQVGDLVYVRQWTTIADQYTRTGPIVSFGLSIVLSRSTANDSVDLSDGTAVDVGDTD